MFGSMGTILRVDLNTGAIRKDPLPEEWVRDYIGGRGINGRILYDEVKPGTDGLSPENVLVFGAGPITGTAIAAGRLNITAMSPLTGIFGDSNAGSHFSPEMKFAGIDHIVVTGKADHPVYLWIDDDRIELRDARHLWGKLTDETQEIIHEELGDPRIEITCIGPAGENLVRLAAIIVGAEGACGKCGLGAVMGSKNLKAVAVRGTKGVKVAKPEAYRELLLLLREAEMKNPGYEVASTIGSKKSYEGRHKLGGLAMKNAQESGSFWGYDDISADTMRKHFTVRDKGCFGCWNHCREWFRVEEGPYAGLEGVGVELSAQEAWGSLMDNNNAASIFKAYWRSNQLGLDEVEAGQLIAATTEWYEKGFVNKEDTGGLELGWGKYDEMIQMIDKIAYRQDIGDVLAEDAVRAAAKLGPGAEKCLTYAKGAVRSNVDLRSSVTYGFAHAISTRGPDHLRGAVPVTPPGVYEGAAQLAHENQYTCTMADAMELCKFHSPFFAMDIDVARMAQLFSLATGIDLDEQGARKACDRIWNLEHCFNVREGMSRKDDILHGRTMDEPMHGGPLDGLGFDREKWQTLLDEYYEVSGWDTETGIPFRETLEDLGLKDIADDLERLGRLPKGKLPEDHIPAYAHERLQKKREDGDF